MQDNPQMKLIEWDDPLTGATGRSGTRYDISPVALDEHGTEGWIVAADGQQICVADSASAAVSRIEHLEALRCMMKGLGTELTGGQLLQAKAIAAEMTEAADRSLSDDAMSAVDMEGVEQSRDTLVSLQTLISIEEERRDGTSAPRAATMH